MTFLKKNIYTLMYVVTNLVLLLDVYRSRTTSFEYLSISSRELEVWVIVLLIFMRVFLTSSLHPLISKLNTWVALPITVLLAILFTIWVHVTPDNYVFSLTLLQPTQVFYISMFVVVVWLMDHTNKWFSKYYAQVLFFGSFAYLGASYLVSLFPRDAFAKLSKEDKLIENMQVAVLLVGAVWAFFAAKKLFQKNKITGVVFFIASLALILIAGDEMSWGQRIFNITTPASIAMVNEQKEITFHNLSVLSKYVALSYVLIGGYGSIAWISKIIFPIFKKGPVAYFIPPWFCSVFFFSGFAYNYYVMTESNAFVTVWAETAELMLYAGISFTMLTVFLQTRKKLIL